MSETAEHSHDATLLDHQPEAPETEPNTSERQLSLREQVMASIVAKRAAQLESDTAEGEPPPPELPEAPEAPQEPPEAVVAASAPEPAPAPPAAPEPPPAPALRTVAINGQQWTVTPDQYDQLAQMGIVAATALSQPQPQPAPRPLVDDSLLDETAQKIQYGSQADAKEALGKLIQHVVGNAAPAQPIDPNQIIHAATQQALAVTQAQRDVTTMMSEFPALFDPAVPQRRRETDAWAEALAIRDRRMGMPARPIIDLYREAGNLVYDQHKLPRPGSDAPPAAPQAAPTVQPRAGVEERKRAAPRQPQTVDRRAVQQEQPREPTGAEKVAALRALYRQPALP